MLGARRRERERKVEKGQDVLMFSGGGGTKSFPRQTASPLPLPEITLFFRLLLLGKRLPPRATSEKKQLRDCRLFCSSTSSSPSAK